jgi:hypothetical protein
MKLHYIDIIMDVQKLWDFAIVVTGNVAGVAADTIHLVPYASQMKMDSRTASVEKIRVMNLGFLSARLIEVKHTLEYFELHQEETIRRRLPGLLAQLEQACTVRCQSFTLAVLPELIHPTHPVATRLSQGQTEG